MPLGLDEVCIPTILTSDVTLPPWRREGRRYSVAVRASTATVGNFAQILFHLGTTDPGVVFVVDTIIIQALDFVTATGVVLPTARCVANVAPIRQNGIVSSAAYTTELYPGAATIVEQSINAGYRFTDSATDPSLPLGRVLDISGPTALVVPCQFPISGLQEIQFGSVNAATAANTSALAVSLSGQVYSTGGV
jgi:hypothetical protein